MSYADLAPQLIEIRGLPAHALLVHLTVVVVPVACLGALAYLNPKWRDWLRWPLLVVAVIAFVSIWAAFLSGDNFKESVSFFQTNPQIEKHEELADVFRIVGSVFAVVVVALTTWVHKNGSAAVRTGVAGLGAVLAIVTLVYVVLTGEAGAKAVYPPGSFDSAPAVVATR